LAEPVFIVGILHHSMGEFGSKKTMAPDNPGSIPILIIIFFQNVLQDMIVCGYNVLPNYTQRRKECRKQYRASSLRPESIP